MPLVRPRHFPRPFSPLSMSLSVVAAPWVSDCFNGRNLPFPRFAVQTLVGQVKSNDRGQAFRFVPCQVLNTTVQLRSWCASSPPTAGWVFFFLEVSMSRIRLLVFGTATVGRRVVSDAEAVPLSRVVLLPAALAFLRAQSEGGQWCGGVLFGAAQEGKLRVLFAGYGGMWPLSDPLGVDSSYVAGVTDALQVFEPEVDWVGQWLAATGRQASLVTDDLWWWRIGLGRGLLGSRLPLLSIGWAEGELMMAAYLGDSESPAPIPVVTSVD